MTQLEFFRREKGLNQIQLAELANVEQVRISAFETGKSLIDYARIKTLCRLAKALDVKIYSILSTELGEMLKSVSRLGECKHDTWFDGFRISEMRKKMKMTQQDVADELFVTQSKVAKWESTGVESLNLYTICQLCICLDCHPCDLIDDKNLRTELRGLL